MTTKKYVNLKTYRKAPRQLAEPMLNALGSGGGLHPILDAVASNNKLRFDIRDRRFNIYYGGGSLMLVDGRVTPWALSSDDKYFKGGALSKPNLPSQFATEDDIRDWVAALPKLIEGMEDWWKRHPKVERAHCQKMATTAPADYLVLDLEYQWAQRRFDMIAAKRKDDGTGWAEPDLVFIEVKSEIKACSNKSGLGDHARDYQAIITASDEKDGNRVDEIKNEYENVIAQKRRLGLLDRSFDFKRFSPEVAELLMVFVGFSDSDLCSVRKPLSEVKVVADSLGTAARIRLMRLDPPNYEVTADAAVSPEQFIDKSK